jgi:hypothetical protein
MKTLVKNLINISRNKLNDSVSKSSTTNLKLVGAVLSAFGSVACYWILQFVDKNPDPVTLGMVFTFILTWLFDGRKQFEIKRKTQWVPKDFAPGSEQQNPELSRRREMGKDDGTEPI